MEKHIFLVVGDSHSIIWEGNNAVYKQNYSLFENVKVCHLGPALAFNLLNNDLTGLGKWGEKIVEIVQNLIAMNIRISGIMLCFGEIDVRTQIVGRTMNGNLSIDESARVVSDRVINFASLLFENFRLPVFIWEPVPTGSEKIFHIDSDFPRIGTEIERNFATCCMSKFLREGANAKRRNNDFKIYSFGIYEQLTNCFETKNEYFEDGCHLNLKGFLVALDSLKALCIEHNLDIFSSFEPSPNLLDAPFVSNISRNSKISLSSEYCTPSGLSRIPGYGWCFHTNKQKEPSIVIDIGYAAEIFNIVIYNRFDACFDRAKNLSVFVGNDLNKMKLIYENSGVWGVDGKPFALEFEEEMEPVRYVAMRLMDDEYFHLGEVQINVKPHRNWDVFSQEAEQGPAVNLSKSSFTSS